MSTLRSNAPAEIAGKKVVGWSDYKESVRYDGEQKSDITLPKSNVLEYRMEDGSKLIVRPSGTEPKIKIYLSAKAESREAVAAVIEKMKAAVPALLGI